LGHYFRGVTYAGTLFPWNYVLWDTISVELRTLGHYFLGVTNAGTQGTNQVTDDVDPSFSTLHDFSQVTLWSELSLVTYTYTRRSKLPSDVLINRV